MAEYIEKQAAIKAVGFYSVHSAGKLLFADNALKEIPPADVRPVVRGRWIVHYDDIWPTESTQECSECHEEVPLLIDCKFCPNCGADMREQEEKPKKDPFEGWSEELKETYRKLLASLHLEGGDAE